ncbi:MAG TPA: SurA N-terminal domain-containing protein [Spirochaetota bacterium]|nr:SurA N-terminal domain-containing protein [Spirochaetota bacterium]
MRHVRYTLLAVMAGILVAVHLQAVIVEKIAIKVNDEIITQAEIIVREQEILAEFARAQKQPPPNLRQFVTDQLVNDRLITQLAKKEGVIVGHAEVEERIKRILKGQSTDLETFKANLVREGISYDAFYEQTRKKIVMQKLFFKSPGASAITPDDREIEDFYKKNAPQEMHLMHCYVSVPVGASFAVRNAKERQIKAIETALAANPWGFAAVAAANSEMWRDWGYVLLGPDIPKYLLPAFSKLTYKGQVFSFRVVNEIPGFPGFHALFLVDKRQVALDKVRDRISSYVYEEKLNDALEAWILSLRKGATIITMP